MSGALKSMLRAYFRFCGVDQDDIETYIEGSTLDREQPLQCLLGKSPRYAMETLGTEWGRDAIGEDLWLHSTKLRMNEPGKYIVTDIRAPNELEMVKSMGAKIFKVVRTTDSEEELIRDSKVSSLGKIHDYVPIDAISLGHLEGNNGIYGALYAMLDAYLRYCGVEGALIREYLCTTSVRATEPVDCLLGKSISETLSTLANVWGCKLMGEGIWMHSTHLNKGSKMVSVEKRNLVRTNKKHRSETFIDSMEYDYCFTNSGTIEYLYKKAHDFDLNFLR